MRGLILKSVCATIFLVLQAVALAQSAPDLTVGTTRYTVYTNSQYYVGNQLYTYNLGPTGLRGWIYVLCNQANVMDNYTTNAPFQILVTSVGTNTPAAGILFSNDVILGVKAGLPPVSLFTNDTRRTLGNAITDAEAGNGQLSLLVNRYEVSTNVTVTIQLAITNMAYSATAPYNCPKSALILSNALKVINKTGIGYPSSQVLALLASGNTNYLPLIQSYAHSIAPADLVVGWPSYQIGLDSWTIGLRGLILAEYYQVTHDSQVTNALTQYIGMLAKSDTMWGCYGHGGAKVMPYHVAAGVHGYGAGYGPVNACGLLCKLAMAVAQKTGIPGIVNDPEFQPALNRSINFYGYYVQKGMVPYGEMSPYLDNRCPTGKDGLAALFFGVLGNQPTPAQYFTRLSLASHHSREWGHNGGGWSLCWDQLGTVMGGTNAVAAYAANTRWYQELARRSDGSFTYDCPGDTPSTVSDYWGNEDYQGCLDPTGWNALFLSAPKAALYITGKNANPTNYLAEVAVSNAVWAGLYDLNLSSYSTNELIAHLSEYQPSVRHAAAQKLAALCATNADLSSALVPQLITLTTHTNAWVRSAACDALGAMPCTNALNALAARMYDTDVWVRFNANSALANLGTAALPQLMNIMMAFTNYATPDPLVSINWSDPCGWGNGNLAGLLFNTLTTNTLSQSTNLLYPVIRAGLRQPDRLYQGTIIPVIRQLQWPDVQALAPALMSAATKVSQANEMYGAGAMGDVLACLAKFGVDDGLAALAVITDCGFATDNRTFVDAASLYKTYGTEASQLLPTLYNMETTPGASNTYAGCVSALQSNTTNLPVVHSFKQFTMASATPSTIDISAATNVVLNMAVTDLSGWGLRYEWSVAQGPGLVSFSNSTNANCTASFSAPGVYVLQAGAAPIMDQNLFWDPTLPGGAYMYATPMWTFSTWTNFYGATYTNMIVTVVGSPAVDNTGGVINQTLTSATLQGLLTAGGRANAWICWGDHDAGINSTSAWDNVQAAGVVSQGAGFSVPVTGLVPDKTYFYRCFVANEDGQVWSAAAISFSAVPARNGSGFGMMISFTNYNRAETLTNFPALVVFSNGMAGAYFDFSTFLSTNGYDLRFTDSTGLTNLNYEIESWPIGGSNAAYVWVQVPRFYSNCCIWAKWGNFSQTNQLACTTNGAAWDSTFKGVWHFPLGANLTALDSTSNHNDGTVVSATANNGVIGGGMNAASGSQYIELVNHINNLDVSTGDWTMQAWAKPSSSNIRWVNLVNVGNYGINGTDYIPVTKWGLLQNNSVAACADSSPDGSFQHVVATRSGTAQKIYINGSLQSGVDSEGNYALGGVCRIGAGAYGQFSGSVDEVRIEGVARSSNWVWACYMNMASNSFFNTPSAALPLWPIANLAPTSITTNSATLNASLSTPFTNYAATVFWGATNGGTNVGAWTYGAPVGSWTNVALTNIAYQASGLSAGTKYYYAFQLTNATTNVWATPSWQFLTLGVSGGSPPGKFKGISVSGTALGLVVTNGSPGGVWTLLQSTNLALPVSQWQTNCTGTYDSGGNLSTNIANTVTNRMGFYLLK